MKKILALLLIFTMCLPFSVLARSDDNVSTLINNMSLRDKITQMLMVDFRYWDENPNDNKDKVAFTVMNDQVRKIVEDYNFGAIIYFAQNLSNTEQSFRLTEEMQKAATKDGGIPMLISADQEGGSVYRLGTGTALPGNMALGATYTNHGTEYAYEAGKIIGSELNALGINTNLAPVVDVNNNANNPVIGLRSYSDDATIVGEMASATIKGMAEYNVIGCAKHFPGHGDTATDSHYGLPCVDKSFDEIVDNELRPYNVAINEGIEMIMTAHILYPQLEKDKIVSEKTGKAESLPATMSDDIVTHLLKEEMGFSGVVVTDAMNMAGISGNWNQVQAAIVAIQAGIDMLCMPCSLHSENDLKNLDAIINGIEKAVEDNVIPMSRINDAVTRILTLKHNRGILDYNPENYTAEKALAIVGSDYNRETERKIAAAAVTLIKNDNNVLPLSIKNTDKVLMLVPFSNESAQMLMGWNRAKKADLIPDGAQVRVSVFNSADMSVHQKDIDWADIIIINSEISNASRMAGNHWLSELPSKVCAYAKNNGKISVISSVDKPYDVQLYSDADAIVATYGCKGSTVDVTEALTGGVTSSETAYGPNIIASIEVILGVFDAEGTLPVNIPKYDTSTKTYTDEIVYSRGYGLSTKCETDDNGNENDSEEVNTNIFIEFFNRLKEFFMQLIDMISGVFKRN